VSVIDFSVRTAELEENAFVVSVSGEVDLHTAPELQRALDGIVALGGTAAVIDLAEVSFIDSTTLAVLVRGQRRLADRGGRLVVVVGDRRVFRAFEITGLDRLFRIERTLADGVTALVD
jgi:anti-sigma B factor antagonist